MYTSNLDHDHPDDSPSQGDSEAVLAGVICWRPRCKACISHRSLSDGIWRHATAMDEFNEAHRSSGGSARTAFFAYGFHRSTNNIAVTTTECLRFRSERSEILHSTAAIIHKTNSAYLSRLNPFPGVVNINYYTTR